MSDDDGELRISVDSIQLDTKEKRKAEVRARLEQAAASKKKKGFMTAARKKKLRNLIRALAAEELKREQARKAEERARILAERTGAPKNVQDADQAEVKDICKEYFERLKQLEGDKYDLEYSVSKKDYVKNDLALKVSHVRGKFQKPALKKVSKAQAQMEKIKMFAAKANQMDHRMGLKSVQKFAIKEEKEDVKDKPDWAGGPQLAKESAESEEEE